MPIPSVSTAPAGHLRPWNTTRFHFGVCYYPEHWDDETRRHDIERMLAAGLNVVRMGEFAWDLFEPAERRFDFSFYDRILADLHRAGIAVILGTPTAAPPRWLTQAHPEVLRQDAHGVRLQHGSRQHACTNHPVFRRFSRAVTTAMAQHFSAHPAVIGWQTDNEFHCHFSECHCPACQEGFRENLRQRYGDIATLNRAWGNAFWSQTLSGFEHVQTPRDLLPAKPNPSARLDYLRFLSDGVTSFQSEQIAILRAANPAWFVTHNGIFANMDYRGAFTRELDVLGVDIYPMFIKDVRDRPYWLADIADRTRCMSGNFIVPEQQAGAGGQPGYLLDTPVPGEMRQMAYGAIARGADSLLFFRWRSCRFGTEEYWCGILDHDNLPRRRYRELSQMGAEIVRVGPAVLGTSVRVEAAVAFGDFDVTSAGGACSVGLPDDPSRAVHRSLLRAGYATGLVHPADDISRLKLYWIPHWELFREDWVAPLERWVAAGGVLVIGARTGTRTPDNHIVSETWPGCLRRLAGVTVEEFGRINHPESRPFSLVIGERRLPALHWYEQLQADADVQALATWGGQHLDGTPAITIRPHGQGQVVYLGTWSTMEVADAVVPLLAPLAGLTPQPGASEDIHVVCREGGGKRLWFIFNHRDAEAEVTLPEPGRELLLNRAVAGTLRLERRGCAVIQATG